MNMLRMIRVSTLAAGLALSAPAHAQDTGVPLPPPPASAQQSAQPSAQGDGAWNTGHGMIFSLQNVFTQSGILGNYDPDGAKGIGGGVGVQFTLSPQTALRFSVNLSRTSNPAYESTTTVTQNGIAIETTTFNVPSGWTSTLNTGVSGAYIVRMTTSAISPYVGGGASLRYDSNSRSYEDSITNPGQTLKVDNADTTFAVGLGGQLGLEWRVHRSVSLFAEYGLRVDAFSVTSSKTYQKTTSTTQETVFESKGTQTKFFNFDTGLTQAGQLGLVAYF
jgi:opacity protein-like surface antigen